MYDTSMTEEAPVYVKDEDKEDEQDKRLGTDLFNDVSRDEQVLKRLFTLFKRACIKRNMDDVIRLANAISNLGSKKADKVYIILKVDELFKGKTTYRPK